MKLDRRMFGNTLLAARKEMQNNPEGEFKKDIYELVSLADRLHLPIIEDDQAELFALAQVRASLKDGFICEDEAQEFYISKRDFYRYCEDIEHIQQRLKKEGISLIH